MSNLNAELTRRFAIDDMARRQPPVGADYLSTKNVGDKLMAVYEPGEYKELVVVNKTAKFIECKMVMYPSYPGNKYHISNGYQVGASKGNKRIVEMSDSERKRIAAEKEYKRECFHHQMRLSSAIQTTPDLSLEKINAIRAILGLPAVTA